MRNVVDQSAWWNPLLTSAIFTWLGATYIKPCVVDSSFIVTRAHQKIKSYFAALILIILNVVTTTKNINKICTKLKIIVCGLYPIKYKLI